MYYLVKVDHNGMILHFARYDCEGFYKCILNAMQETDDMLWNGSDECGNVRNKQEEYEGTD